MNKNRKVNHKSAMRVCVREREGESFRNERKVLLLVSLPLVFLRVIFLVGMNTVWIFLRAEAGVRKVVAIKRRIRKSSFLLLWLSLLTPHLRYDVGRRKKQAANKRQDENAERKNTRGKLTRGA
jgi:hypothetical protein